MATFDVRRYTTTAAKMHMAWETRKRTKRYYYRSFRQDGRVKRQYCGRGERGALAAEVDLLLRLEAQERKEAFARWNCEEQAIVALLEALALILDAWLKHELRAQGWTIQRSQWREPPHEP